MTDGQTDSGIPKLWTIMSYRFTNGRTVVCLQQTRKSRPTWHKGYAFLHRI